MRDALPPVPPFRMEMFESYEEFERYLRASDALRGSRWLYERTLATSAEWVVLDGICALCLQPTQFKASTRGGETAHGGRVPNWREGLACACTHALINRERALLHYLLAQSLAEPWMRVLALGEVGALRPMLEPMVGSLDCLSGPIDIVLDQAVKPSGGYHLVLSVEQLNARLAQPSLLSRVIQLLTPGGSFVLTAPFDVAPLAGLVANDGALGWSLLEKSIESGFARAKAFTYWSEELGYLGAFNFILRCFTQ